MKGMLNEKTLMLVFLLLFLTLLVGCFPPPTNQTPIITSSPVTAATVGVLYAYDVNATDPDGDTLTYSLAVKPTGMTIKSKTGVISWRPTSTQIGNNSVIVKVSDGKLSITQSFTIKVSTLPTVNQAPVITSVPITTATVGVTYICDVKATDPDGDTLTYSLTTKPSGMVINSTNGLIWWTPTSKGTYTVVVKVSDGFLSDTQGFTITVSELPVINQAPVIYSTPSLIATVGVKYNYTITATDPDGDVLTYSLISWPTGMTFDGIANISWTPTEGQVGAHNVTVKASDGILSDTQSFTITVSAVEPEPEIELTGIVVSPAPITLLEGVSQQLTVIAHYSDESTDNITSYCIYESSDSNIASASVYGLVTTIDLGTTNIAISYTPDGEVFNYKVEVTVVDTIQEAIDAALAGDTIEVPAGTYNEAISIDKQLTLLGAQYDVDPTVEGARLYESAESIIDAGGSSAVITITADSVIVNGFTITNGGGDAPSHLRGGVCLIGTLVFGCTISNNKIVENLRDGIDSCASGSGVNVFENNVISNNGYGAVYLGGSKGGDIVRNNVISYNEDKGGTGQIGIQSSDNVVEGNTINGDTTYYPYGAGILIMGSHADIRKNNILRGNIINRGESGLGFWYGIGIAYAENTLVEDNIIHNNVGGAGVFEYVDTTSLIGNDIQDNDEYGIKVGSDSGDTKDTTIEENDVLNNGVGIWIRATDIAASTTHINQNNIVDNTDLGVLNEIFTLVDATNNWWGDATGPNHVNNPNGLGNAVSDNVDFDFCLDSSYF